MRNILDFDKFVNESALAEGEGIHPAIREKLVNYLKENPKATFAEAKEFIGGAIKGWKLTEEDFEEAKKSLILTNVALK